MLSNLSDTPKNFVLHIPDILQISGGSWWLWWVVWPLWDLQNLHSSFAWHFAFMRYIWRRLVTFASGVTNAGIDLRNRDQFTQLLPPAYCLNTISTYFQMGSYLILSYHFHLFLDGRAHLAQLWVVWPIQELIYKTTISVSHLYHPQKKWYSDWQKITHICQFCCKIFFGVAYLR